MKCVICGKEIKGIITKIPEKTNEGYIMHPICENEECLNELIIRSEVN